MFLINIISYMNLEKCETQIYHLLSLLISRINKESGILFKTHFTLGYYENLYVKTNTDDLILQSRSIPR